MIISKENWIDLQNDESKFKNFFNDNGFAWVKKFISKPGQFKDIVDKYTLTYSNDAARRDDRFGMTRIKNVDPGYDEMPLHSESSFSPNCPDIIWFYCVETPSHKNESTTICDGAEVWKKLSKETKHFLLNNPIEYKLSIDLTQPMSNREWFLNRMGCGKAEIIDGKLDFVSKRFAVNELFDSKGRAYIAFANHLFALLDKETQIISREINGKKIPKSLIEECNEICSQETQDILWETGDFIFLNNKRFMHGRRAISPNSKRDIVIAQTERTTF